MKQSVYDIYSTTADAWGAMYQEIQGATTSIFWEMYIFVDDDAGRPFFDVLKQKARTGVDVKLIVDWFGSFRLSGKEVQALRDAGVDVRFFNEKKRLRGLWRRLISRTHRKILIVDERVGFIGGVNIQKHMRDWLDIHVRLEGRVVRSLLRSFAKSYVLSGGARAHVKKYLRFRHKRRHKKEMVEFVWDDSMPHSSRFRRRYEKALKTARKRVVFFSPYYLLDKRFIQSLWRAKKRGVRVDLLLPLRSDVRIATYAAYGYFGLLKKLGVNVRLTKKMMHGKGVVVDDEWAIIGSSNVDHGSFHDNYEAGVQVREKKFVSRLQTILDGWMQDAVTPADLAWERRGVFQKIKERVAQILYRLWHRNP